MPIILVTNDDGIHSPGLIALARAMRELGDVYIVAPDRERSAVSHSLTLHRPLKVEKLSEDVFSIDGTPTDCVILAISKLLPDRPALVASGINRGGNLGGDISYSGTVSGAIEGTILGIPSFAISLVTGDEPQPIHLESASAFATRIGRSILEKSLPPDTLLNINVPNADKSKILGIRFTRQGKIVYNNAIQEIHDPRGKVHYWLGGSQLYVEREKDTDVQAVSDSYISITPIHLDLTNYDALNLLRANFHL
ncbi:MAG: 5'/3'-nucleotidase SurE [Nitrospirae bacterium RBG_13_39_12]|nr:MAG: 5'/3'-nucleotidase SurE [Nitrospirae bacterium RBG_13_39_12]